MFVTINGTVEVDVAGCKDDFAVGRYGLHGVMQEVHDHFGEMDIRAFYAPEFCVQIANNGDLRIPGLQLEVFGGAQVFFDDEVEIGEGIYGDAAACHAEKILDDCCRFLSGFPDGGDLGVQWIFLGDFEKKQVGITHQAAEDVVEIVGDARGQIADYFHLLCLEKLLFKFFPIGDVFGKALGTEKAFITGNIVLVETFS